MVATLKNKRTKPIVFYYLTENGQKSTRVLGGENVVVDDFVEVSNFSKNQVENGFFEIIIDVEKSVNKEEKMKKALEDVESYMKTKDKKK